MITNFCVACGTTKKLETHHIIPQSLGGDDSDTNLLTLCNKCHGDFHGMKNRSTSSELTKRGHDKKRCIFFIIRLIHECWADRWMDDEFHGKLISESKIYYHNDINYDDMFSYEEIIYKYISVCCEMDVELDLKDIRESLIGRALYIYKTDILYYDYLCRFYDVDEDIQYRECPLLRGIYL